MMSREMKKEGRNEDKLKSFILSRSSFAFIVFNIKQRVIVFGEHLISDGERVSVEVVSANLGSITNYGYCHPPPSLPYSTILVCRVLSEREREYETISEGEGNWKVNTTEWIGTCIFRLLDSIILCLYSLPFTSFSLSLSLFNLSLLPHIFLTLPSISRFPSSSFMRIFPVSRLFHSRSYTSLSSYRIFQPVTSATRTVDTLNLMFFTLFATAPSTSCSSKIAAGATFTLDKIFYYYEEEAKF